MANVGAHNRQVPLEDNQVPPLEEVAMGDQLLVVPPPKTDGEIRTTLLTLDQADLSR